MDTTKPSEFSISPAELSLLLAGDHAPLVIDVRKNDPFLSSEYTLHGALRRDPLLVDIWASALPKSQTVLVYCVYGHEVGIDTMNALRKRGINASFLRGGFEGWREAGLPLEKKAITASTQRIEK